MESFIPIDLAFSFIKKTKDLTEPETWEAIAKAASLPLQALDHIVNFLSLIFPHF